MHIATVWDSTKEVDWRGVLEQYLDYVKPQDQELVRELKPLDLTMVEALDAPGWYSFLHDKYFRWKYSAPNRLATTRKSLTRYSEEDRLEELLLVRNQLLAADLNDISAVLRVANSIHGLGIAGASGLLALMYPTHFGTVDQFLVTALSEIPDLVERDIIRAMLPAGLTLADGVLLTQIMRRKAADNNATFESDEWTPRMIDQVLWIAGHKP